MEIDIGIDRWIDRFVTTNEHFNDIFYINFLHVSWKHFTVYISIYLSI